MSYYVINKAEQDITDVTVYGIPYNYDDRAGKWNIWNISLFISASNVIANKDGAFLDLRNFKSENLAIVWIKRVLKISPEIYNLTFLSRSAIRVKRELYEHGRSSVNSVTTLEDINTGNILAKQCLKLTAVNTETRTKIKFPDWFVRKYSYLQGKGIPKELARKNIPVPPKSCFEYKSVVRHSDQDSNLHTSQSVYTKLCFDCATEASLRGKLVYFTGDIAWYPVLYLSSDFLGESFPGDELEIALWQDENNVSQLSFIIYKGRDRKKLTYVECRLGMEPMNSQMSKSKL